MGDYAKYWHPSLDDQGVAYWEWGGPKFYQVPAHGEANVPEIGIEASEEWLEAGQPPLYTLEQYPLPPAGPYGMGRTIALLPVEN